jgi:hypothetical protein
MPSKRCVPTTRIAVLRARRAGKSWFNDGRRSTQVY